MSQPLPEQSMSVETMVVLLRFMLVRSSRQIDVDKIVDQKTPADRCLLVARLVAEMSTDPVVARSIRETNLIDAIKQELLRRRDNAQGSHAVA
jgi:hypothetical protein